MWAHVGPLSCSYRCHELHCMVERLRRSGMSLHWSTFVKRGRERRPHSVDKMSKNEPNVVKPLSSAPRTDNVQLSRRLRGMCRAQAKSPFESRRKPRAGHYRPCRHRLLGPDVRGGDVKFRSYRYGVGEVVCAKRTDSGRELHLESEGRAHRRQRHRRPRATSTCKRPYGPNSRRSIFMTSEAIRSCGISCSDQWSS